MFFHLVLDLVNELIELVFFKGNAFLFEKPHDLFASILTFFRSYEKSDGRTGDSAAENGKMPFYTNTSTGA